MPPDQVIYENTSYRKPQSRHIKLWVVFAVVVLAVLLVVQWASGQAYLDISLQGQATGIATFELVNQTTQKRIEFSADAANVKKRIPKGAWELTIRRDNTNAFSAVETGSFFSTTKVSAKAETEKDRRFVGNSTKSCMNLVVQTLVSYRCNDSMSTLQFHIPASSSFPPYAKANPHPTEDVIEGLIHTKEGSVLVIYEAAEAGHEEFETHEGESSPHIAFTVRGSGSLELAKRTSLDKLDEKERYAATAFRDGFIMYEQSYEKLFYYSSVGAEAVSLPIAKPNNDQLYPYALATRASSYAIAYQVAIVGESEDPSNFESEVVVQRDDQTRNYTFDRTFDTIRLCADNKLCGISSGTLYVFDIASDAPKLLFRVNSVKAIDVTGDRLIVVRDKDVIALNADIGLGAIQYSFGEYHFCGLTPHDDTYILCVSDTRGKNAALLIDQSQSSDEIDKKIAELQDLSEIGALSIYGKYIYITADTGAAPIYNNGPGDFGYDPAALRDTTNKIKQELSRVGIDQKKYSVKISAL